MGGKKQLLRYQARLVAGSSIKSPDGQRIRWRTILPEYKFLKGGGDRGDSLWWEARHVFLKTIEMEGQEVESSGSETDVAVMTPALLVLPLSLASLATEEQGEEM